MAAKEGELVGDDRLVLRAVVDVEVIDAGIGAQLAERGPPRRRDRRSRLGDPVGLADADQPGAVQVGGVAAGTEGSAEQPARGDRLRQRESSPIATTWRQPGSPPGALMKAASSGWPIAGRCLPRAAASRNRAVTDGEERCAWLTMSRNGTWLIAAATSPSPAAAASALPPPIEEPNVATRSASMPGSEAGERDCRPPVVELARGLEQVRLAAAVAEAAMVEDERRDPRRREALGERPEPVAPRAGEPVGHDDDRRLRRVSSGRVQPGGAAVPTNVELEILTVHA